MPLYMCISLDCREAHRGPFEASPSHENAPNQPIVCPHCGYSNAIRPLALIHYLIRDIKGPIKGDGANYRLVCGATSFQHLTGDRTAANCPECLKLTPVPIEEKKTPPPSPNTESVEHEESKGIIEGQ